MIKKAATYNKVEKVKIQLSVRKELKCLSVKYMIQALKKKSEDENSGQRFMVCGGTPD